MSLLKPLLHLAFPDVCVSCHQAPPGEDGLCPICADALPTIPGAPCPGCGGPLDTALEVCSECLAHPRPWERAVSCLGFRDLARRLVHRFKYDNDVALAPLFARLAADRWAEFAPDDTERTVTAVPLHWLKQWRRGYNQSALFARGFAARAGLPYADLLRRARWTKSQTRLDFDQRRRNLKNVFATNKEASLAGRHVLLVDDVLTTGATLDACTRVLRGAGVASVAVLTLARG